jgi:protein O-mannosyl-transferase
LSTGASAIGVGDLLGTPFTSALAAARLRRWAPVIVALSAILVYVNALTNGYVLDDRGVLLTNPLVTSPSGIWRAFAHPYWPPAVGGGQYRPLVIASFAFDWWVSGGAPGWLHAVNVLWHAAASVLVWLLAAELLPPAAALAAAALFAVHPVHVEAVANIVGRSECMAAFFVVAALLDHRRQRWGAPLLFALALLSKENAAVFLPLAALNDLWLAGPPRVAFRERRALYGAYAAVAVGYAGALAFVFRHAPLAVPAPIFAGATVGERWLTFATVIPEYARLLLVPWRLSADYQPAVIELARSVTWGVVSGVLLASVLTVAIFKWWRAEPGLAFSLAWLPVTLAPVSNLLVVTGVVLAERTLYLPSVGAMLAAGWLVAWSALRAPRAVGVALVAVILLFAGRTWTRTAVWHDSRTFALTLLEDHPESYRAHWVMARVMAAMGRTAEAEREYGVALELFPRDPVVWREAAELRLMRSDWSGATTLLEGALALRPRDAGDLLRLADVRYHAGDLAGALTAARAALVTAPDSLRAAIVIGAVARSRGDVALADTTYARMTALHPASWEMQVGYADVLLVKGDTTMALAHAERAVELSGGAPAALAVRTRAKGMRP